MGDAADFGKFRDGGFFQIAERFEMLRQGFCFGGADAFDLFERGRFQRFPLGARHVTDRVAVDFLLDAVVDRFGTRYVQYAKVDEEHFGVTAKIEISDQFYGWLLGFGDNAKLVYPEVAVEKFRDYLDRIREMY